MTLSPTTSMHSVWVEGALSEYACVLSSRLFVRNHKPRALDDRFGNSRSSVLEIATLHKALEILVAPFKDATRAFAQFREVFSPVKNVPTWSYGLWFSRWRYKDQRELESVLQQKRTVLISGL